MSTISFLGFDFIPITMEHQEKFEDFFKKYPQKLSGYSFASLLAWSTSYIYAWTYLEEDTLLISNWIETLGQRHLLQPIGTFSPQLQQIFLHSIAKNNYPIRIYRVSDQFIEKNGEFCSHFEDLNDRNRANYIYNAADLATLVGGHFEKKRNLIAQAEKLYQWTLQLLTEKNLSSCTKILANIGIKQMAENSKSLQNELKALDVIFANFFRLHQKGCMINVAGEPAAFAIYNELNPQTADIYFEKAEKKFKGLYQLINRETAKLILNEGYEFINREEDLGVEGLRQAKKSYFPIELISSHLLTYKTPKSYS